MTSAGEPAVRRTETDDDLLADRMARLIWSTLLAAGRAELADAVADQLGRMPAADLRVRTVLALRVVLAGRMTDGEVDALVRRAVLRDEVSLLDRSDRELMGTVGADPDRRRRVCGVVAGMVDRVTRTLAAADPSSLLRPRAFAEAIHPATTTFPPTERLCGELS